MTINLYNTDCMQALREMPDNMYDLAIVDPPYGLNMAKSFSNNGNRNCKNWGQYEPKEWDSDSPTQEYFDHLFRVSRHQIIWGGNYFMDKIKSSSQGWIVWNKGQREFTLADGELAYTSFDRAVRIFDYSRGTALAENKTTGGMFHPTKKPVRLYEWILSKYTKQGDTILDTHLGSGSIALACHNMGYSLDAYEIDAGYFASASARLHEHQRQIKLFT